MADDENSSVLGIIGGSGLYDIPGLADTRWRRVASPFGEASDEILLMGTANTLSPALPNTHPRLMNRDERREAYG